MTYMKKLFSLLSVVLLTFFSFYYTDRISDYIKDKDPIMMEIIDKKTFFETKPVNAVVEDSYIIPGLCGFKVDIDKTYYKMKKLGSYNKNLYTFIPDYPNISIKDTFDKVIISGNKNKKQVSLVFKIDSSKNVSVILDILKNNNVVGNFFIDGKYFEDNVDILKDIALDGHFLGNLGYDGKYDKLTIKNTNSLINRVFLNEHNYCIEDNLKKALDICSSLSMYTVKANDIKSLKDIKDNLSNGGIYNINIQSSIIDEVKIIIKYIKQKGYDVVSLEELISENYY